MPTRLAITIGATLLALGACSTPNQKAAVGALESSLTAADILALQYTSRPVCPVGEPVCADPAVKLKIKAAAEAAYDSVKAAEASAAAGQTVDFTASTATMVALQSLLTSVFNTSPSKVH